MRRHGTPLYLYDLPRLRADARAVREAFPDPWLRLYALKANGLPGLVREIVAQGFLASAVSRGELVLARRAGVAPTQAVLEGIGKSDRDLRSAAQLAADGNPLLWISLESADEAAALAEHARRLGSGAVGGTRLDVLVRVNPQVAPETVRGLAVGAPDSKFGVLVDELPAVIEAGGGLGRPAALARSASPCRLAAGRRRRLALRVPDRVARARAPARDAARFRHARCRRRFPGTP